MSTCTSLRSLLNSTTLPQNEAKILLAYILEKYYQLPRSALLSRDEMTLSAPAFDEWQDLETRRCSGEPIAYLVGKRGFHNIELYVAPGVLIPRPETEILVEIALREIIKSSGQVKVLDLGTGSGAIALALAHSSQNALLTATDQSLEALEIAERNAQELGLADRVQFLQGNWFAALNRSEAKNQFDLILSNPPYIAAGDRHLTEGDLRFEPSSALTDGANGLSCLENIISQADFYLKPDGLIALEHGFDQATAVMILMKMAQFQDIQVHQDLAGHPRATSGRKPRPE